MERNLSGGRCLNVIWQNRNLSASQKLILHYLASQLNFNGNFSEWRWYYVGAIAQAASCTERQVQKVLKKLTEDGYLQRQRRFENNRELASSYAMTDKVFACSGVNTVHQGGAQSSGGVVNTVHPELPQDETPSITPSILPAAKATVKKSSPDELAKRRSEREACEIISSIIAPARFINFLALKGAAKVFVARYGIEAIRLFRDAVIEDGMMGCIEWQPQKFNGWLEQAALIRGQ